MDESHVEHLVGFVENERLNAAKIDESLIHQVEQPAGRGHQNVDAPLKCFYLRLLADTAVNYRLTQAGMATVGPKAFCDLRSQFACRRQDQYTDRAESLVWTAVLWIVIDKTLQR